MRWTLWWTFVLAACARTPPTGASYGTSSAGDDDDGSTSPVACDPATAGVDCTGCDAAGMWATTRGLQGDALVAELHRLTDAQTCDDYGPATTFMFVSLDNVGGQVACVYTGNTHPVYSDKPDGNVMNTEHTWLQSEGADVSPAECDLHHLYPTETSANSLRANWPFGVVVTPSQTLDGGSRLGVDAHGATVFEPRDAHKGNVARAMAYFAMRYDYPLSADQVALFEDWAARDPVDEAELTRTERIAERQGAVNPYVTCPWLVDAL